MRSADQVASRITVNLAPADLPKDGSHYDLPIALGLMAAIGAIPPDALNGHVVLGELGLDGAIAPVAGVLPETETRPALVRWVRRIPWLMSIVVTIVRWRWGGSG
jgi:predicted ATPase with chaperone activity